MIRNLMFFILLGLNSFNASTAETLSTKIVGGTAVNSAPSWMVALWITTGSDVGFCAGTLIDSQWIMTAAHCVDVTDSYGNSPVITATIGQADLSSTVTQSAIDSMIIYPSYTSDTTTMYGDIALLHLASPQYGTTVTLPYSNQSSILYSGLQMRIYGWGETDMGVTQSNASAVYQLRTATITYQGTEFTYPDHIFAGDYGKDTCFGDSGGPLLYNGIQYGITSFGFSKTCATGLAGGYTDVSYYSSWIDSTIGWAESSSSDSSGGGGDIGIALMGLVLLLLRLRFRFQI
jgi:secreted trypsin-like serine protease